MARLIKHLLDGVAQIFIYNYIAIQRVTKTRGFAAQAIITGPNPISEYIVIHDIYVNYQPYNIPSKYSNDLTPMPQIYIYLVGNRINRRVNITVYKAAHNIFVKISNSV